MQSPDVIVIGGGAAGCFAALRAKELGARVLLLEKNAKLGVKILASGGGRCNLTTTREGKALLRSFRGAQEAFLKPAFAALSPRRLRAWFAAHGVKTVEEDLEKVFPEAGRARVVQEALSQALGDAGVEVRLRASVRSIEVAGPLFLVRAEGIEPLLASQVILAVGGKSYPKTGTTGDGYAWLRTLGHTITATYPALAALISDPAPPAEFAGLTLPSASVWTADEPHLRFDRPVLFTHRGLSGPGPMDVAGSIEARGGGEVLIAPAGFMVKDRADALLREALQAAPRRRIAEVLPREIPSAFRRFLVEDAGIGPDETAATLRREARLRLADRLCGLRLTAKKSAGYDHAEVTRGGVALPEVDPKTMASLVVPGLYLCGEILDIDGPIGGFNFQAAFATGLLAGEAAARARSKEA